MQIELEIRGRRVGSMGSICARHPAAPGCRLKARARQMVLGLGVLCLCALASAVEMESLYTVQVPLDPDAPDAQNFAYETALTEVLVRVTGATGIAEWEQMAELFPNPGRFVLQYRPGPDDTLMVSLDGPAIEEMLRQAGIAIWENDRPLTLMWIAVDWGQGEREIVAADDPERKPGDARSIDRNRLLRERVAEIAAYRGIPVLFPLLDIEDLENISFSDIWGGFDEAVLDASERYDVNSILIGRVRPGDTRQNRWRYYFSGEQRNWIGEPELAIGQVADVLAAEFAISGSERLETVELVVEGIASVAAYGEVHAILADVSIIESFALTEVEGDRIRYRVDAHGGASRLRRALRFTGLIEQNGIDPLNPLDPLDSLDSQVERLEFFYSP